MYIPMYIHYTYILYQVPPGNNAANNYRLRVEGFSKVSNILKNNLQCLLLNNLYIMRSEMTVKVGSNQ